MTLQGLFLNLRERSDCGVTFINGSDEDTYTSYKELFESAMGILGFFQGLGVSEGDELVFQLGDSRSFVETFWGCILGRIVPVPVNLAVTGDLKNKLHNVFKVLNTPYLITTREHFAKNLSVNKEQEDPFVGRVIFIDVDRPSQSGEVKEAIGDDIAYIQFSSGSTGNPKGVILTHRNLVTNINSIHEGIYSPKEGDRFLSWMPLTHDMGLIGFHLTPLAAGWDHYIMPTELFMRNPSLWLRKMSDYKISFSSSPNFGYKYLLKHFSPEKHQGIDLSSLRIIVNGAEPISLDICQRFVEYFKSYGLRKNAIFPVYGLAEASLAVTFSIPETEIFSVGVDRNSLNLGNEVDSLQPLGSQVQFVSVGRPIENTSLRLVDGAGVVVGNNFVGKIQIKGDNVTSGYYNNLEATAKLITHDGWLNTGDLGFEDAEGNLYIVGRDKDVLFVNGGNFYSHDLERISERVEGIELGKIVVTGGFNPGLARDEVVAFVLFRGRLVDFISIKQACMRAIGEETGITLDHVVPVKSIPKTTSGKVQRYKLLKEYLNGEFEGIISSLNALMGDLCREVIELPKNKTEEDILLIWRKVLGRDDFGVNDDFFALGGNSLKAGQLVMNLQEELYLDVSFEIFYRNRTVRGLSKLPITASKGEVAPFEPQKSSRFGLSHAQSRIFYYYHANKGSTAYNIPLAFTFDGLIDVTLLRDALIGILERHDILRTTFHLQGDTPYQLVHEEAVISFEEMELDSRMELEKQVVENISPFELEKLPLIRLKYGFLQTGKTVLAIDIHHIVADGTSAVKIIQELLGLYKGEKLTPPIVQYGDYVAWEERSLASDRIKVLKDFWSKQFRDGTPPLSLPYDFSGLNEEGDKGAKCFGRLGKEINQALELLSNSYGISKSVILLASYSLLLHKLSGQEDIIIGVAEAGRNHPAFLDSVGMFVNNLPVRLLLDGNQSIERYLIAVNEHFTKALDHKVIPYNELVNVLNIKRVKGRNPLFETMFVYQNMDFPGLSAEGLGVTYYPVDPGVSKFDLTLEIMEGEELGYGFEYSSERFKKETIARFSGYYKEIVRAALENQEILIKDIGVLSGAERDNLSRFNETDSPNPRALIHELFEQQALRTPNANALLFGDERITYSELNQRADELSSTLIGKGIHAEDFVAILADRSAEFIIAVLAVLKSGGAYVPIDPSYPIARREYILKDCNARFILTTKAIRGASGETFSGVSDDSVITVDELGSVSPSSRFCNAKQGDDSLAYMIYTSGTSGKPKGVMVEHRNLVNYVWWAQKVYVKNEPVNFPLFTSVAFDLTVTSIFTPLITGGAIVIYAEDDHHLLIEKVLADDRVGVVKLTPSHLKLIKGNHSINLERIKNLRRFIVGGEDLSAELAESISTMFNDRVEIFNEYGPTETTVGCMIYRYDPKKGYSKSVPIGIPADNAKVFLLDKHLRPVPQGVVGEIFVSGDGVGRGYHNNEGLTDDKFIVIPGISSRKSYRTGDLGRFGEDGVEFLGRSDQQVKVNGYRVELDEIEQHVQEYEGVKNAVVLKVDRDGFSTLCAYYEVHTRVEDSLLRAFLQKRLPHYMVPAQLYEIERIPLTPNGKVDREALLLLEAPAREAIVRLAENEIQALLVGVFKDVLGAVTIGIDDNFFEMGGDSIKAVQITSRLYDRGISLNVKDILTRQTIAQISLCAEKSDRDYEQGVVSGEKALTPMEEWFFEQDLENPNYYNQSVLLEFRTCIDKQILEKVFEKLIAHHDGLRLNYNPDKKCMFFNDEHLKGFFNVEEFTIDNRADLQAIGVRVKSSFDISKTLLLRAGIIREGGAPDKLLITAHHLIIDGVSWRIILEDFYNLYKAINEGDDISLPKKTGSLIDWQNSIKEYSESEELKKQIQFWKEVDEKEFSLINHSKIINDEVNNLYNKLSITIDKETTNFLLKDANKPYNSDIQILLLTVLSLALKEWIEKDFLVVELENYGRHLEKVDVSRTIGWFTTLYPLVLKLNGNDIGAQIKEIKERIRTVPEHGIGYGILKYISPQWRSLDNKISEIRFNYLGQFGEEVSNNLFSYTNEYSGRDISEVNPLTAKLEVNSLIINGELNVEFNYCDITFKEYEIISLRETFKNSVLGIVSFLKNEDDIHFTPSDFDIVDLEDDDLEALFEK